MNIKKKLIVSELQRIIIFAATIVVVLSLIPALAVSDDTTSTVIINDQTFTVGSNELQAYLDKRDTFVYQVHFPEPRTDLNVNYLLNSMRVFLKEENIVTLQGDDIDRLTVELNSTQDSTLMTYDGLISFAVNGGKLSQTAAGLFRLEVPPGTSTVT